MRSVVIYSDELYHHGIKGQRWGIRRFQNDDGTLTEEGKRRYLKRQEEIDRNKDAISAKRAEVSQSEKDLKDLLKNGARSKTFDRDFQSGWAPTESGYKFGYRDLSDGGKELYTDRKTALKVAIARSIDRISEGKREIEVLKSRNKMLMDAPISEKTYFEQETKAGRNALAALFATSFASGFATTKIGGLEFGINMLPISMLTGLGSYYATYSATKNSGVKSDYRDPGNRHNRNSILNKEIAKIVKENKKALSKYFTDQELTDILASLR